MLRSRGGFYVTHELDSAGALHRIETEEWDLLITDIELPGMTGLELLDRVRRLVPGLPVAVLTGHPTVDYAVTALRNSAAEFMQKPIAADDLVAKATELVEAGRKARAEGREIVLAIGAHPDDVEIGAGGTLLAHRAAGDTVAILTLSRGARGGDQAMRAREAQEAADVIGARLFLDDLEDTRIQEGDPTIGVINAVITELQPTVVYTHSVHDVHQDHRNVHRAAMVAARRVGRVLLLPVAVGHDRLPADLLRRHQRAPRPQAEGHRNVRLAVHRARLHGTRPDRLHGPVLVPVLRGQPRGAVRDDTRPLRGTARPLGRQLVAGVHAGAPMLTPGPVPPPGPGGMPGPGGPPGTGEGRGGRIASW